jgi:anaerobic selenocysteine-containing dehydrogenase
VLRLMTLRSDDQFNTTIYSLDDRFRGIYGTRRVLLMNRDDMQRLGVREGDMVDVGTVSTDDTRTHGAWPARDAVRHSAGLRGRLLPGMQPADSAVAPRREEQGARGQGDPRARARGARGDIAAA